MTSRLNLRALLCGALLAPWAASGEAIAADGCQWQERPGRSAPVIGYGRNAAPFSFWDDARERPAGFIAEICQRVADGLADQSVQAAPAAVATSTDDRFEKLRHGEVDMLCGAITHTLQRRHEYQLRFSTTVFVTGAEIVFSHDQDIDDLQDLVGLRVGVMSSTTTANGLAQALARRELLGSVQLSLDMASHAEGIQRLRDGQLDAYVGDWALLQPYLAKYPELRSSGRLYSFEPYAIATRECDNRLSYEIDREISQLFRSGEIWDLYRRYFPDQEPSHLLIATFILGGLPPGAATPGPR